MRFSTTGFLLFTLVYAPLASSRAQAQGPVVSALAPDRNAIDAPAAGAVTVGFTQAITAASAPNLRVYSHLRGRRLGPVGGGGTASLSLVPTPIFAPGERVSVTLPPTLLNAGGNGASRQVYQFTVATGGTGRGTFLDSTEIARTTTRDQLLGDIDHDGDLDLLTTGGLNGMASYLNDGTGRFAFHYQILMGQAPSGAALADVNQDGFLDLLAGDASNPTLAVALNDGTGDFGLLSFPNQVLTLSSAVNSVATGDLDGDGDLDFAAASPATNSATVGFNDGAGRFGGLVELSVGTQPSAVRLADIDNDGDLDLLTSNRGSNNITVRLNNGLGSFGASQTVGTGVGPADLVLADIDGDGDLDLLTANAGAGTVSTRINTGGAFASVAPLLLPTGSTPTALELGDVDADGDLDLLVAQGTGGQALTYFGYGNGAFATQATALVLAAAGATKASSLGMTLGDVDGDGDLDLVTANGATGRVVLGRNTLPPVLTAISPASGVPGDALTLTGRNLASTRRITFAGARDNVVTSGFTVNAAGTQLAGVLVPAGATTGPVRVATGGGTSTSSGYFTVTSPLLGVLQGGTAYPAGGPAYDFGAQVVATAAAPVTFTLQNTGGQPLLISSATTTGPFAIVGAAPASIAAGGSGTLTVVFSPPTLGAQSGTLLLASNSGGYPSYTVPLQGAGVVPAPVLASFSPASTPVGAHVVLTGRNLAGASAITFDGLAHNVVTTGFVVNGAGTEITDIEVPSEARTGLATVTTPGGTSAGLQFTVLPQPPPTLTSITPSRAAGGTVVTLTGTNLLNTTTINFAGIFAQYQVVNSTTIRVTVPAEAASGQLILATRAGYSNLLDFVVPPRLTMLQPYAGPVGTPVTILGKSLGRATSAQLNGLRLPVTTALGGLQATIPAGAASGSLTVTTPDGLSNSLPFVVTVPVELTSIAPASGASGTVVTLTGTNLQGALAVSFAGTANNTVTSGFVVNAAGTQLTGVVVPSGATSGAVFVTTANGVSSLYRVQFTVASPAAPTAPAWLGLTVAQGGESRLQASATDAAGNVYVVGDMSGSVAFGNTVLAGYRGGATGFLAKWSPATHDFVWAKTVSSGSLRAVAVSGSSLYITGYALSGDPASRAVGIVAKFTEAGDFVWQQGSSSGSDADGWALAVQGNAVYVAGSFTNNNPAALPKLGGTAFTGIGGKDAFVAKLLDAGSTASFAWALEAGSAQDDEAHALALAGTTLYVGGQLGGPARVGSLALAPAPSLAGDNTTDGFVAKIVDAGSSASVAWGQLVSGQGRDNVLALAAQGSSVYVTGQYQDSVRLGSLRLASLTAYGGLHGFVAKLQDAGPTANFTWAQPIYAGFSDTGGIVKANALAVSGAVVYVGGRFLNRAQLETTTIYDGPTHNRRCFVARYLDGGSTSSLAWVQIGGGSYYADDEEITCLSLQGSTLYAGGYAYRDTSKGTFEFPPYVSPATGLGATPFLTSLPHAAGPLAAVPTAPLAGLGLYPNPAHGEVIVQVPPTGLATTATLSLYNALGQPIATQALAVPAAGLAHRLALASLPAGVYLLRVTCASATATKRLVVE